MKPVARKTEPLCPSARVETPGAQVFGVVDRAESLPQVRYLKEPVSITNEVVAILNGAPPGEVWRLSARCAGSKCRHFDGSQCSLGERLVQLRPRPQVSHVPPPCALRAAGCRWFNERGIEVCLSCRWVVSDSATLMESEDRRMLLATPIDSPRIVGDTIPARSRSLTDPG